MDEMITASQSIAGPDTPLRAADDVGGTAVRMILAIVGRKAFLQSPLKVRLAQRGQ